MGLTHDVVYKLTKVVIGLHVVCISKVIDNGLHAVENAHMTYNTSVSIGPGECALAYTQIFEAKTPLICGKVGELAETSVCVTVKAVDEAFEVQFPGLRSKVAVVESCLELTSNVEAAALVLSKHVEHLCDACERIFGPGKFDVS